MNDADKLLKGYRTISMLLREGNFNSDDPVEVNAFEETAELLLELHGKETAYNITSKLIEQAQS